MKKLELAVVFVLLAAILGVGWLARATAQDAATNTAKPEPSTVSAPAATAATGGSAGLRGTAGFEFRDCPFCHTAFPAELKPGGDWGFQDHDFVRFSISKKEDYVTCVTAIVNVLRRYSSGRTVPHRESDK